MISARLHRVAFFLPLYARLLIGSWDPECAVLSLMPQKGEVVAGAAPAGAGGGSAARRMAALRPRAPRGAGHPPPIGWGIPIARSVARRTTTGRESTDAPYLASPKPAPARP